MDVVNAEQVRMPYTPHCTLLLWLLMAVRLPPQRIIFNTQGADS